jgi:dTDP-glucose pyrophosphorylase
VSGLVGAILAAGRGTRMRPFSDWTPKPAFPICKRKLIAYQIDQMSSLGIYDIEVLVVNRGFEITRLLGDGAEFGVRLRYVEQTQMLGIAHAVGCLEPHIDQPFLLFLGDIFFVARDLAEMPRLLAEQGGGAVLATKLEPDREAIRRNFSVVLDERNFVTRVVEKPRHPATKLKGVGLYLFDVAIFDAVRRTPRTAMRDEYELTDSIQVLIGDGHPVRVASVVDDDVNVTTPDDLLDVNLRHAKNVPAAQLTGAGCRIHPGATIENSVLGNNVVVQHPIRIRDSLLLDDTVVASRTALERVVMTPTGQVACSDPAAGTNGDD